MRFLKFLPIVFLILDSCVEPLKIDYINIEKKLVVDGLITNEAGPYQVKLFYSTDLQTTLRRPLYESGASVWIMSDADEQVKLTETSEGIYQTDSAAMLGKIGRSYKLKITTKSGKSYESTYELLSSSSSLDSAFTSFEPEAISDNTGSDLKDALKISVYVKRNSSSKIDYLRWRWKIIYKARSFPELNEKNTGKVWIPDPEPCSGYVANGLFISKVGECSCCICWSTRYSNGANISKADYVNESNYEKAEIGEIEITSMLFYDRLFLEVEQLSLSENVYEFWKLVDSQLQAPGNLFQPNAVRVHGNLFSTSNVNDEVFGAFSASAVERKSFYVNKAIIPYELPPIDTLTHDCADSFLNGTTEKPTFW